MRDISDGTCMSCCVLACHLRSCVLIRVASCQASFKCVTSYHVPVCVHVCLPTHMHVYMHVSMQSSSVNFRDIDEPS